MPSRYNSANRHMNSQREWQYAQGLHRLKSNAAPGRRGESGQVILPLTQNLSLLDIYKQRKN